EARLDLHGLTAAQAERRLARFVDQAARIGVRCLLVITGKGSEGKGVLRRLVPLWLKTPPLSGQILAISQARQADGGGGALYVMLRRKRQA
ncbi:MAG: Smr/MutS family protein, partial [SAR116 cluster bacterium]|nr:Smr/MutS family protein [SAR116 cluster bacterium]